MLIGCLIKERMDLFNMNVDTLAECTFMKKETIENIINDKICKDNIDSFDLSMISSALYCTPEYFFDKNVREKDIIINSLNRETDTLDSILIKAKIQNFVRDFIFVQDAMMN